MAVRVVGGPDDDEAGQLEPALHRRPHGVQHVGEVDLLLDGLLRDLRRAALGREGQGPAARAVQQIGHLGVEDLGPGAARHLPGDLQVAGDQLAAEVHDPLALHDGREAWKSKFVTWYLRT